MVFFLDSDKSKGIASGQREVLHHLEWLGRAPGPGWFLGKTAQRWGWPHREFIVEIFSNQHPCGGGGGSRQQDLEEREVWLLQNQSKASASKAMGNFVAGAAWLSTLSWSWRAGL